MNELLRQLAYTLAIGFWRLMRPQRHDRWEFEENGEVLVVTIEIAKKQKEESELYVSTFV